MPPKKANKDKKGKRTRTSPRKERAVAVEEGEDVPPPPQVPPSDEEGQDVGDRGGYTDQGTRPGTSQGTGRGSAGEPARGPAG